MKTAIVYISKHHGNTRKLAEAISTVYEVTLIDGTEEKAIDLTGYDCIGFAAGIAFGRFYPRMLSLMKKSLPDGKKVFFLYTVGQSKKAIRMLQRESQLKRAAAFWVSMAALDLIHSARSS